MAPGGSSESPAGGNQRSVTRQAFSEILSQKILSTPKKPAKVTWIEGGKGKEARGKRGSYMTSRVFEVLKFRCEKAPTKHFWSLLSAILLLEST